MKNPCMNKENKSLFIVIEGADYAGKTTLIKNLKTKIQNNSEINNFFKKIIYTNEPNSEHLEFCNITKELALNRKDISDFTRALIFFANRSEHISKIIEPAINKGNCLVICDRFYLSTLVYQGDEHEQWMNWIRETQKLITTRTPDITYLIDIDHQTFTERYEKLQRRNAMDDYAKEKFISIKNRYLKLAKEYTDSNLGPIEILPNQPTEELAKIIEKNIQNSIPK